MLGKLKENEMDLYDDEIVQCFLEKQEKLLGKIVFNNPEEATEFLEDCMAQVCENIQEVREYFDETGTDVEGMSDMDISEAEEVFALPNGKFLVVEG